MTVLWWAITGTNVAVSFDRLHRHQPHVHRILAMVILGYQVLFMFRQLGVLGNR